MTTDGSRIPEGSRTVWEGLDRLTPEPLPADASARIERALLEALDEASGRGGFVMTSKWRVAAALVATLVAGAVAGFGIGTSRASGPLVAVDDAGTGEAAHLPRYLLLVHDNEAVERAIREQGIDAIVERYAAWAGELDGRGRLVGAEKLTDTPRWIGEGAPSASSIGGFFMVRAATEAEALRIARTSPHAQLGGVLEVRAIDEVER